MIIMKTTLKVILLPVWIILTVLWLVAKAILSSYIFVRVIIETGLLLLIAGTILCYHDWTQAVFLTGIIAVLLLLQMAGIIT